MLSQSMVSQSKAWVLVEIIQFKEKFKNSQVVGGRKWKTIQLIYTYFVTKNDTFFWGTGNGNSRRKTNIQGKGTL